MLKKLLAVALVIVVFNLFFFTPGVPLPGTLGFALLVLILHSFLFIVFYKQYSLKNPLILITSLLSLVAIFLSLIRANYTDRFFLSATSFASGVTTLYLLNLEHHKLGALSEIFALPFSLLTHWWQALLYLFQTGISRLRLPFVHHNLRTRLSTHSQTAVAITRGLFITIPIAFLLLLLLSADPAFNKFLENLFNFKLPILPFNLLYRLTYSIGIATVLLPLTYLSLRRQYRSAFADPKLANYAIELTMLVGITSFILATYLIVQFRYLFTSVPEILLHQFGVNTYSEYVRRGFGELTIVSVITYSVIAMSYLVFRQNPTKLNRLKQLNLFLLAEMTIFIISIFRRVYLYQLYHGLTLIRIYGSIFLLCLVGLSIILALRHLTRLRQSWHLWELAVAFTFVFLPPLTNPESWIIHHSPPTVNNQIDYTYYVRLSADGFDGWVQAYDWAKATLPPLLALNQQQLTPDQHNQLYYSSFIIDRLKEKYKLLQNYQLLSTNYFPTTPPKNIWFYFNLSEMDTYQKLQAQIPYSSLEALDGAYQHWYQINNAPPPSLDRSSSSPLAR